MPSDIVGGRILGNLGGDDSDDGFKLVKGPVFTNVLLADEINRATRGPDALLEAMQERQVTLYDRTHPLGAFFVVATKPHRDGHLSAARGPARRFLPARARAAPLTDVCRSWV